MTDCCRVPFVSVEYKRNKTEWGEKDADLGKYDRAAHAAAGTV